MYNIHGFCFDPCTVEYEASLRKAGLYEQYEKRMMQNNMEGFVKDLEQWMLDQVNSIDTFVTEQGEVEDWKNNRQKVNDEIKKKVLEYTTLVREKLK